MLDASRNNSINKGPLNGLEGQKAAGIINEIEEPTEQLLTHE